MGNSCTAILIALTVLAMVPGLTAGTWTREAVPFIYLFGSDTHGHERTNDVWSYDPVSMTWPPHTVWSFKAPPLAANRPF